MFCATCQSNCMYTALRTVWKGKCYRNNRHLCRKPQSGRPMEGQEKGCPAAVGRCRHTRFPYKAAVLSLLQRRTVPSHSFVHAAIPSFITAFAAGFATVRIVQSEISPLRVAGCGLPKDNFRWCRACFVKLGREGSRLLNVPGKLRDFGSVLRVLKLVGKMVHPN